MQQQQLLPIKREEREREKEKESASKLLPSLLSDSLSLHSSSYFSLSLSLHSSALLLKKRKKKCTAGPGIWQKEGREKPLEQQLKQQPNLKPPAVTEKLRLSGPLREPRRVSRDLGLDAD